MAFIFSVNWKASSRAKIWQKWLGLQLGERDHLEQFWGGRRVSWLEEHGGFCTMLRVRWRSSSQPGSIDFSSYIQWRACMEEKAESKAIRVRISQAVEKERQWGKGV